MNKLLFFLLLLSSKYSYSQTYKVPDLLLRNISIINVQNGKILKNKTLLLRDGYIVDIKDVNSKWNLSKKVKTINSSGKFLIPGLMDAHVHLAGTHSPERRGRKFLHDDLKLFLVNGVTSIRNMKSFASEVTLANKIKKRQLLAPNLFVATPALDNRKDIDFGEKDFQCWDTWSNCSIVNKKGALALMDRFEKVGFDIVKLREPLTNEMALFLVELAKTKKMQIAGHISEGSFYPKVLSRNIFDSIEHSYHYRYLESEKSPFKKLEAGKDYPLYTLLHMFHLDKLKTLRFFKYIHSDFNGYFTPTLFMAEIFANVLTAPLNAKNIQGSQYIDKCTIDDVNKVYQQRYQNKLVRKFNSYKGKNSYLKALKKTRELNQKMHFAGAKFVAGTDANVPGVWPGFSLHAELKALTKAGLSNLSALQSATINAAKLMKKKKSGFIKKGYKADLVILNANPLKDISHSKNIFGVIRDGVYINKRKIDIIYEKIKKRASQHQCSSNKKTGKRVEKFRVFHHHF